MITLATLGLSFLDFVFAFLIFFLLLAVFLYIYSSLALMAIAKRTHTDHGWFAWIPFLNIYLTSQIAREAGWPVLLLILYYVLSILPSNIFITILMYISVVIFIIFNFVWWWKICKIRGKPGWWVLITIIPIIGQLWALIMIGILAWGKGTSGHHSTY